MWLCHSRPFLFSVGRAFGAALLLLYGCVTAIAFSPQAAPPAWLSPLLLGGAGVGFPLSPPPLSPLRFPFSVGRAFGAALLLLYGCITAIAFSPQASPPSRLFFFCAVIASPHPSPPPTKKTGSIATRFSSVICPYVIMSVAYVAVSQPPISVLMLLYLFIIVFLCYYVFLFLCPFVLLSIRINPHIQPLRLKPVS